MSDTNVPVQAVEPDPAAASIPNDETANPAQEVAAVAKPEADEAPKTETTTNGADEQAEVKKDGEKSSEDKTEAKVEDTAEEKVEEKVEDKVEDKTEPKSEEKSEGRNDRYSKPRQNLSKAKFDLPESSDPVEIRKQVEFYFSDSNLPQDAFLMEKTGGHKNHPVPIKAIHNFKRMRHFQPYSAVLEALKASTFLDVTDQEEVRRKTPLQETSVELYEDRTQPRSIYVKGFGEEKPSTQFDIEAFFTPYGPVNAIRLRRTYPEKKFKGSVFVEFDSEETQKAFLALDPKPKFEDKELEIRSKKEYVESKAADIAAGRIAPSNTRGSYQSRGRGRGGPKYNGKDRRDRDDKSGNRDSDDWKGRRNDFQGGRGGRGRGRGGRGGRGGNRDGGRDRRDNGERRGEKRSRDDGDKKEEERPAKVQLDSRGIPVVATGKEAPKEKASDAPVPPAMTDA